MMLAEPSLAAGRDPVSMARWKPWRELAYRPFQSLKKRSLGNFVRRCARRCGRGGTLVILGLKRKVSRDRSRSRVPARTGGVSKALTKQADPRRAEKPGGNSKVNTKPMYSEVVNTRGLHKGKGMLASSRSSRRERIVRRGSRGVNPGVRCSAQTTTLKKYEDH